MIINSNFGSHSIVTGFFVHLFVDVLGSLTMFQFGQLIERVLISFVLIIELILVLIQLVISLLLFILLLLHLLIQLLINHIFIFIFLLFIGSTTLVVKRQQLLLLLLLSIIVILLGSKPIYPFLLIFWQYKPVHLYQIK